MSVPAPLSDAIPEETVRVAHAAFPKGTLFMQMRDELGPMYQQSAVCGPVFTIPGNQPKLPHGWPWCWCCNLSKACPTAKLPMPCAGGSIGNMRWPWN